MALYFRGKKVKVAIGKTRCRLILVSFPPDPPFSPPSNSIRLVSADGYVLTDANGVYLTVKERE